MMSKNGMLSVPDGWRLLGQVLVASSIFACGCASYQEDSAGYFVRDTNYAGPRWQTGGAGTTYCFKIPEPKPLWLVGYKAQEYSFYLASDRSFRVLIEFSRRVFDVPAERSAPTNFLCRAEYVEQRAIDECVSHFECDLINRDFTLTTEHSTEQVDSRRYRWKSFTIYNTRTRRRESIEIYSRAYAEEQIGAGTIRVYVTRVLFLTAAGITAKMEQQARDHLALILQTVEFAPGIKERVDLKARSRQSP